MKKYAVVYFLFLLIGIAGYLTSCADQKYDINQYYDTASQDTLMTNIIISSYKTPRGVRKEDRFNPEFRDLYVKQLPLFDFIFFHVDDAGVHYFYMLRPARNVDNRKRGVGGRFRTNENLELIDFEELFVTPMIPEEDVQTRGKYLWDDLMHFGHVDRYLLNMDYVEFPNKGVRYDMELKEWLNQPNDYVRKLFED